VKRLRRRKAKPGQLIAYYGKLPHDGPDVVFAWGGSGASKHDGALLHHMLASKRLEVVLGEEERKHTRCGHHIFGKSFIQELEDRGYDITTIYFSIEQKPTSKPCDSEQNPGTGQITKELTESKAGEKQG
jgi:hypothetical protein